MSFHRMILSVGGLRWIPISSRMSINFFENNCFKVTHIPNPKNNTPEIPTILINKGFRRNGVLIFSASKIIQIAKTTNIAERKNPSKAFFLLE